MNTIYEFKRAARLIESIITDLSLDLTDISVLTETASGPFVLTPIIAAVAGANKVFAVTRNSSYGSAEQVEEYTHTWSKKFGIQDKIIVSNQAPITHAPEADLVTNLGFVRPINESLIAALPKQSAISLMWEPWEFRGDDLDLASCQKYNIPILGTNESHARLNIFHYVGLLGFKLLLSAKIEVFKSSILVIGSGIFGKELQSVLHNNGAQVTVVDPTRFNNLPSYSKQTLATYDAIVIAEHTSEVNIIDSKVGISPELIKEYEIPIIHICGCLNDYEIDQLNIRKIPNTKVLPGYMTLTTADLGIRPIIDLHGAGLKVGESLVKGMRKYNDPEKAISFALKNSPSLSFNEN